LGLQFVLNEGVALVIAAVFVVVVVKPLVLQANFTGNGAAKFGKIPGVKMGVEGDR
jgi:hypothetical protein